MNNLREINRQLPRFVFLIRSVAPRMFISDEGAKYMRPRGGVKGCRKSFSTPPAEHVRRQKMDLLTPLPTSRILWRTAFGATASDLAAPAVEGLPGLVDGEDQAKPDCGENQKMLAPEGHGSMKQR